MDGLTKRLGQPLGVRQARRIHIAGRRKLPAVLDALTQRRHTSRFVAALRRHTRKSAAICHIRWFWIEVFLNKGRCLKAGRAKAPGSRMRRGRPAPGGSSIAEQTSRVIDISPLADTWAKHTRELPRISYSLLLDMRASSKGGRVHRSRPR